MGGGGGGGGGLNWTCSVTERHAYHPICPKRDRMGPYCKQKDLLCHAPSSPVTTHQTNIYVLFVSFLWNVVLGCPGVIWGLFVGFLFTWRLSRITTLIPGLNCLSRDLFLDNPYLRVIHCLNRRIRGYPEFSKTYKLLAKARSPPPPPHLRGVFDVREAATGSDGWAMVW